MAALATAVALQAMAITARKHFAWSFFISPAPPPMATCRDWRHREGDFEEHDHDFVEVVLITAGRGMHRSAQGEQALAPGSFMVLRPGAWHAYHACRGLAGYDLCFVEQVSRRALPAAFDDPLVAGLLMGGPTAPRRWGVLVGTLPAGEREPCREALATLAALHERTDPSYDTERLGAFLTALGRIARAVAPAPGGPAPAAHPATATAARLLETELARDWDMPALARAAGLEASALTRRFRRTFGLPPMAWLNRRRAERAAALLSATDRPIGAVGAEVGWFDANYFARRFRAAIGMAPSAYRRRFRPLPG